MTALSIVAFVFGTAGVWLTIRQTVWCWPVALVAVVTSAIEFYRERLFGDMALQVFYFFAGVYGWVYWNRHRSGSFSVRSVPISSWAMLGIVTAVQAVIYYYIITHFRGDRAFLDALLTAASLTATYMMTRKWLENWLAWVVIDVTYIYLYAVKDMWLFAALYLFFAVMAGYGYYDWRGRKDNHG